MLGLGDVAAIGVPAARILRSRHLDSELSFLTLGAGEEVMSLVAEVDSVISITKEDWPDQLLPAIESFTRLAERIIRMRFEVIYNFDTWFMPCLLARILADNGVEVRGNRLRWSASEVLDSADAGTFRQEHASLPTEYLASSFPNMVDWSTRWWEADPTAGPYPRYYLQHCCGFESDLDYSLPATSDPLYREAAGERPIIALSLERRAREVRYPFGEELAQRLEGDGFFVWSKFDGSQPMHRTLGQLKASDLLITVGSAPQWLAQSVGCATMVIPGHLPPATLGADVTVARFLECQFCQASTCVEGIDYACYDVPPAEIAELAASFLASTPRRR